MLAHIAADERASARYHRLKTLGHVERTPMDNGCLKLTVSAENGARLGTVQATMDTALDALDLQVVALRGADAFDAAALAEYDAFVIPE